MFFLTVDTTSSNINQFVPEVRMKNEDPECGDFKAIQLVQNKLLRLLNGTTVKDRVSTASLLTKFGIMSVNQLNAKVKLLEIWKALNVEDYPLKIKKQSQSENRVTTRNSQNERPIEIGKSNVTQSTSTSDAIRIWNKAPDILKDSKTIYQAKNQIKSFVKNLTNIANL